MSTDLSFFFFSNFLIFLTFLFASLFSNIIEYTQTHLKYGQSISIIREPVDVNRGFHEPVGYCRHRSRHRFSFRLRGTTYSAAHTEEDEEEERRRGDESERSRLLLGEESGGPGVGGEESVVREEGHAEERGEEIDGVGGEFGEPDESEHENEDPGEEVHGVNENTILQQEKENHERTKTTHTENARALLFARAGEYYSEK